MSVARWVGLRGLKGARAMAMSAWHKIVDIADNLRNVDP